MASTQLDIYNLALVDAAMQPLETITEASESRSFLNVVYATTAAAMLERFDWHFARIQSIALVKTTNTGPFDGGFQFEYALPADSISSRVIHPQFDPRDSPSGATGPGGVSGVSYDWVEAWEPDDSAHVLRTNLDEAYVIYTEDLDFTADADIARLSNVFVEALALNLAARLITRFSQDPQKTILATEMTTRALEMARAHSLGRGIGAEKRQTRSLRARRHHPFDSHPGHFGFTP